MWIEPTVSGEFPMKAVVYEKYGGPEVLKLTEVEKPEPGEGEVLVRTRAVSVNSWDWDLLTGKPFIVRMGGLFRPGIRILGADIAGVVEKVGSDVNKFKVGDEVFGDLSGEKWGGFAEYVAAKEGSLESKPDFISFQDAAAIPQAGVLALQGIVDYGDLQPGQKVLINGAGGGVGTFAIQIARSIGADVTGVDSGKKLELMKSAGADHVIDYRKDDFTRRGMEYDLIMDVIAKRTIRSYRRALKENGQCILVGGKLHLLFASFLIGSFGRKKIKLLIHKQNEGLDRLLKFYQSGKIKPVIDSHYYLEDVPEAMRKIGRGMVKGKIVISIDRSEVTTIR